MLNSFLYAGFDYAYDNSAKFTEEDIQVHANDETARQQVNEFLAKFHKHWSSWVLILLLLTILPKLLYLTT